MADVQDPQIHQTSFQPAPSTPEDKQSLQASPSPPECRDLATPKAAKSDAMEVIANLQKTWSAATKGPFKYDVRISWDL